MLTVLYLTSSPLTSGPESRCLPILVHLFSGEKMDLLPKIVSYKEGLVFNYIFSFFIVFSFVLSVDVLPGSFS